MNYTQPRDTKDIDPWIKPDIENSHRVASAFARFRVPLIAVTRENFAELGRADLNKEKIIRNPCALATNRKAFSQAEKLGSHALQN